MAKSSKPKKQEKKLTRNQQEAITEINRLKNRGYKWKKKYHIIPTIPDINSVERVTKKFIESIKRITYKNLTEKEKQEFSQNYTRAYDRGEIKVPRTTYEPPTETQFIKNGKVYANYEEYDREIVASYYADTSEDEEYQRLAQESYFDDRIFDGRDNDFSQEPIDTADEIDAYLEGVIDEILEVDTSGLHPGQSINYMARDQLENLLWEARRNYGDKGFYAMVQDKSFVSRLQEAACAAQLVSNDRNGDLKEESKTEIIKFATILNNDAPLSLEQQEMFWATQRADIGLYDED